MGCLKERRWRRTIEGMEGYVPPVTYPFPLVLHARARNPKHRSCFLIDPTGLPEFPCVYVMRFKQGEILRIGTAAKGLPQRVYRGYNRPFTASLATMNRQKIHDEWGEWAGGAHLTNALVLYGLHRRRRRGELQVELHAFPSDLLKWERLMLDAFVVAFGKKPALNRGLN
jgi:hypothetical protein